MQSRVRKKKRRSKMTVKRLPNKCYKITIQDVNHASERIVVEDVAQVVD